MKMIVNIIFVSFGLLIITYVILLSVFCWSGLYKNNNYFDSETNRAIKSYILRDVKNLYSKSGEKSLIWGINRNFMNSGKQIDVQLYELNVQTFFPNDWTFIYRISFFDDQLAITFLGADP